MGFVELGARWVVGTLTKWLRGDVESEDVIARLRQLGYRPGEHLPARSVELHPHQEPSPTPASLCC